MGGACRRAGGLAAVAGLLLLAACTGGRTDGSSAGSTVPPTTVPERPPEAFYAVADPLPPGPPGALIRALPIAGLSVLPGSRAWAVLYHSRDFDGRDTAVSGVVVAPPGAAPPGGWPVVVWGHGSAGLADRCAPPHGGVMGAFGPWLGGLLQQGDVVAASDDQGLGTPGPARATIGLSAGHAVLDVARAARGLQAGAGGRVVLDGHSEGGHAVLWAAELARAYAPELQVLGVAASAPGAELTTPPWPALLARNTPGQAATRAPIFLAQGADDDRVTPAVTGALVGRLCRLGDTVELRTWQNVGHFDIAEVASADVAAWIGGRLAGRPARSTCQH